MQLNKKLRDVKLREIQSVLHYVGSKARKKFNYLPAAVAASTMVIIL